MHLLSHAFSRDVDDPERKQMHEVMVHQLSVTAPLPSSRKPGSISAIQKLWSPTNTVSGPLANNSPTAREFRVLVSEAIVGFVAALSRFGSCLPRGRHHRKEIYRSITAPWQASYFVSVVTPPSEVPYYYELYFGKKLSYAAVSTKDFESFCQLISDTVARSSDALLQALLAEDVPLVCCSVS
eukprot:3906687-Amphidinium_carterae.1